MLEHASNEAVRKRFFFQQSLCKNTHFYIAINKLDRIVLIGLKYNHKEAMIDNEYAVERLSRIQQRIMSAAQQAGRPAEEITLIGAAKQQTAERIAGFVAAGLFNIGENYLQEALTVQPNLGREKLQWHYIGHIQSNKTSAIATHFDWVHSVDRFKIARRLAQHRTAEHKLNLLVQVDIDDEPSKGGVAVTETETLCSQISELENIQLRGIMVLPKARTNLAQQREPFARARALLEQCNQNLGLQMDCLSMGMSNDLEAAILEGSTMVRVGTDLFGARNHENATLAK